MELSDQTNLQIALYPFKVDVRELAIFLRFIVEGEQRQVEVMLQKTPELALACGDAIDLSNRTFKSITGFQYAVWALDWHMWTMIRQYLSDTAAREQIQLMSSGTWVRQYGQFVSWQNLLNALQKVIILCDKSRWDDATICWQKEVGGAQRLLPAHVVNEYCHPTRPFECCPDFKDNTLPRTRMTDMGEWFTANYNNGEVGETFAFYRYTFKNVQCGSGDTLVGVWWGEGEVASSEYFACQTLLQTRFQQRDQLLFELS